MGDWFDDGMDALEYHLESVDEAPTEERKVQMLVDNFMGLLRLCERATLAITDADNIVLVPKRIDPDRLVTVNGKLYPLEPWQGGERDG